jgi:rare lipoprotein A
MRPQRDPRTRRACATIMALGLSYAATAGASPGLPATSTSTGLQAPERAPSAPVHATLSVRPHDLNVLEHHAARIAGVLRPGLAGRVVRLQVLGAGGWRTVAHSLTGLRGGFRLRYMPRRTVSERARVSFAGDAHDTRARHPIGRLNVYRLAAASWYGGGGGLACGGSLTSATMGVANKTLPCGTLVTLHYGRRTVRVRVIDRGPFVAGREFDLTQATKEALGFGDTGEVWSTA